jgi:hypothetical protein
MVGGRLDFRTIAEGTASTTAESLVKGATLRMENAIKKGWIEGKMESARVDEWKRLMEKYGSNLPELVAIETLRWGVVGPALGGREKENMYGQTGEELAKWESFGVKYDYEYFRGYFTEVAKTHSGKWRVVKVKSDLLNASVGQNKEKALEELFALLKEASKNLSIEEIKSFVNKYQHMLSKEERAAIDYMLNHLGRKGSKDTEETQQGQEEKTTQEWFLSLAAGSEGSYLGVGGGLTGGFRTSKTTSDFLKTLQSKGGFTEDDIKQAFAFMIGNHLTSTDKETWEYAIGKHFKDTTSFTAAAKKMEQYKELEKINSALQYNLAPKIIQMYADTYLSQYAPIGINNRYELAGRILSEAIQTGDVKTLEKFAHFADQAAKELEGSLPSYRSIQKGEKDIKKAVEDTFPSTLDFIEEQRKWIPMYHLGSPQALFAAMITDPKAFGIRLVNAPNNVPPIVFSLLTNLPEKNLQNMVYSKQEKNFTDMATSSYIPPPNEPSVLFSFPYKTETTGLPPPGTPIGLTKRK